MQKTILFLVLAVLGTFAAAQTPTNHPTKTLSKTPAKSAVNKTTPTSAQATAAAQARAAAEATAQAQAQAIADAAASVRAAAPRAVPATAAMPAVSAATGTAMALAPHTAAVPANTDLAADQMAIAGQVHQGLLPCELGASVRVEADAAKPGYFHLLGKGFRYHMHPVRTSTGAIRLEDAKAGAVWLQLANKSMLMDQTKGRRVADECAHPEQTAYAKGMKTNPPPSLFDTTGMGRPKN